MIQVYSLISFVTRGKIRIKVMSLLFKPMTPTQLSEIIVTHRSTVSRAILSLESKNLVECITPNEKMGRYYQITDLGKKVMENIEKWSWKNE